MNPEGRGRVENEVVDASFLLQAGIAGIPALIGPTQWGEQDKSVLLGSLADYEKFFGGLLPTSDFPLLVQRMLRRGAPVRVARIGHYTNPADASTLDGTKADLDLVVAPVAAVVPQWQGEITAHVADDTYTLTVDGTIIGSIDTTGQVFATPAEAVTYIAANLDLGASGFVFTQVAATATFAIAYAPGTDAYNDVNVSFTGVASTVVADPLVQTVEGVTAVVGFTLNFEALSTGIWGNTAKVKVDAASSGDAGKVDITVDIDGHPELSAFVPDLNAVFTAADMERFNLISYHVKMTAFVGTGSVSPATYLAGGLDNAVAYSTADYMGNEVAATGIHVFDSEGDFIRIAAPMIADPTLDAYLVSYVESRGDCRAWLRTPMVIDGRTAVDYRKGTGIYTHNPVDSWRASMVYGDIAIKTPSQNDSTILVDKNIQALTEVLANAAIKDDKTFNWFSTAGSERGKIPNNNGVVYNLGTAARKVEFDLVDKAGINAVIKDLDFGTVYWGNGTLQGGAKTLLSNENIAELLIYLSRVINPIAKGQLFNPNDPVTWRTIFKRVTAVMTFVEDNRGVYGWDYQGDQMVTDVSKVVVNTTGGLDAGKYVFRLFLKPTPAMKYVGIKTIVTNSGASFELL